MKRFVISLTLVLLATCQSQTTTRSTTTLGTIATSTPASSTTTSTSETVPIPESQSAVYLFFEGYPVAPGPYLTAVARPAGDLSRVLAALLQGTTENEGAMGLSSTIPPGTELLGVEVLDSVAQVDLSREFETGGGSLSMMGRVAQVVYTATRFEEVDSVRFLLEGAPLDVLGGEGLIIDEPQTRSAWTDLIPPILIENPMWGSILGNEVYVNGTAYLDSGEVSYVIVDADGSIVDQGEIASTPGRRSEFTADVVLDEIPSPGSGSIIVWEWAPDGSQQHVLEYPLTLVATR